MSLTKKEEDKIEEVILECIENYPKDHMVWDDIRFPATEMTLDKNSKLIFDNKELGLLFPQNDPTAIAYMICQMLHNRKNKSSIRPHIHYIQDSKEVPVFKMAYRWYPNGGEIPAWTTLTSKPAVFPYNGEPILQISQFPEIDGASIDTVSSMLDIKLYRDNDDVSGSVLLKEFDFHYQIDQMGSRDEFKK